MIEINKVFSQEEIEMMNHYVMAYAGTNDSYPEGRIPFEEVLQNVWVSAKAPLYKAFGEKLIISKEVEFTTPVEDMYPVLDEMFRTNPFLKELRLQVDNHYYDRNTPWREIGWLLSYPDLILNKRTGSPFEIKINDKVFKVQSGTKVVKLLGKIAEEMNIEGFEEFRLEHSRLLNRAKLKGELCLSIHPMDYLTMSDNSCDWASCMSWEDYGCYRRGTVEMMNSPIVVVAYLKAAKEMRVPGGYRWNNKKWRTLVVLTDNFVTTIKGYPYQSNELSTAAIDMVTELADGFYKPQVYECEYWSHGFYTPIRDDERYSAKDKIVDAAMCTSDMYNDFGTALHYLAVATNIDTSKTRFNYSGDTQCVWCGGIHCDFGTEEQLICYNCGGEAEYFYCQCCDSEWSDDGEFIYVGNSCYCPNCIDEYCFIDDYTEDYVENDEMVRIHLVNKVYNCDIDYETLMVSHSTMNSGHFKTLVPYKYDEESNEYYVDLNLVTDKCILNRVWLWAEKDRTRYFERIA